MPVFPDMFECTRLALKLTEASCKARWSLANAKALSKKQRTQGPAEWRMSKAACKDCPIGKAHAMGQRVDDVDYTNPCNTPKSS